MSERKAVGGARDEKRGASADGSMLIVSNVGKKKKSRSKQ